MSSHTFSRIARVNNPKGLHLRPAGLLAQMAGRFQSQIELTNDGLTVNARSVLDLLTLVATAGSQLTVTARGEDAQEAVDALADFIETDTTEDEQHVATGGT